VPVLCVGEKERDPNHGYIGVVKKQITESLRGVAKNLTPKVVVAYEPVWAISSTAGRRDATAADSKEMAIFIRRILADLSSPEAAASARIIYGGSVNAKSAGDFLENGGVDGLLPGKASLDPEEFAAIVKIAEKIA
jgi:triosephosphate isomerase